MHGIIKSLAGICAALLLLLLLIYLVGAIKDFVVQLISEYEVKKWIKESNKKRNREKRGI